MLVTSALPSGAARLAETNRFALSVRSALMPMYKPKHGGAAFVTCIRRTLEPCVDGQHRLHTWKRECASRLFGVATIY